MRRPVQYENSEAAGAPVRLAVFAVIFVFSFVFTGCSNEGTAGDVAVTGVRLLADDGRSLDGFNLVAGENKILSYRVLPAKATNKTVRWGSSDTDVAIASEGVVYAIGKGTATITVTTRNGNKTAACTVHVTESIAVTGVALDKTALFLAVGSDGLLNLTVYPANATNKKVTWTSNPGVATVSANGTVRGVAAGKTTITVTTEDGEFEAACAVTVVAGIPKVKGMVWIDPGTFMMGSPFDEPESFDNEIRHSVTLTEGFYMGIYPVQQKQWADLGLTNWSYFPDPSWDDFADRWEEFPVEYVSWHDAIVFCNLLSMDERLSPAYTMYRKDAPNADGYYAEDWVDIPENWSTDPEDWGYIPYDPEDDNITRWNCVRMVEGSNGYRLPTEAQWEYACRAGTPTPFNTGNNITSGLADDGGQANYWGTYPYNNGGQYDSSGTVLYQTIPSGMYEPNAWGLYDMHGNVWEWCWDWYGSYNRGVATDTDPKGPDAGTYRILRGGSYYDDGGYLRSAYRNADFPVAYEDTIGFRVVRPYSASSSVTRGGTAKMSQEGKIVPQRIRNFDENDRASASPVRLQATRRKTVVVE
jgi:formylglycine-generating enzyme required for sulfatase activity